MNKRDIKEIKEQMYYLDSELYSYQDIDNLKEYAKNLEKENQQLKKQKDDVVEFIKIYRSYEKIDNKDYLKSRDEIGTLSVKQVDYLLRMLGEIE